MRHVQFTINDGRTMDLEVSPRLEEIIRERQGWGESAEVSDADIKRFVLASLVKAGE